MSTMTIYLVDSLVIFIYYIFLRQLMTRASEFCKYKIREAPT